MTTPLALENKVEHAFVALLNKNGTEAAPALTVGSLTIPIYVSDEGNEEMSLINIVVDVPSKSPTPGLELCANYDMTAVVTVNVSLEEGYDDDGTKNNIHDTNDAIVDAVRDILSVESLAADLSAVFTNFFIHGRSYAQESMSQINERVYQSTFSVDLYGVVATDAA